MKPLTFLLIYIYPMFLMSQDINYLKDIGSLYHGLNYETYYTGHAMHVDNEGSIYITGRFTGQKAIWSPDPNPEYFAKVPANNYFIQKIDKNGIAVWHKLIYSADLFSTNGPISVHTIHLLDNIYVDELENVYAGGTFRNQVEIDNVISPIDSTFSSNLYLSKFDANGELQYLLQGLSITQEKGGSNLIDITSKNIDEIIISVTLKDSLIINIATKDTLIQGQTIIYGSDFLRNTTTENAILKINANSGKVLNHKVFKSSTGNGSVYSKLCMRDNGNLVLMGGTSSSLNYNNDITYTGSLDEKIFIAEMDASLENPPHQVDFGKLINGHTFFIDELKVVKNNVLMFYGFFRGDRIEIYNSSLEGSPNRFNSFIGLLDIDNKKCQLIKFSNRDEADYISKIKASTDGKYIYAVGRFWEGDVIVKDTIITIAEDDPDNLILTKLSVDNLNVQDIIRMPSCSEAVGIEVLNNSIYLAADYHIAYSLGDEEVETNKGYKDIWFSRLTNLNTTSSSTLSIEQEVYPNPTSNALHIKGVEFDRIIIRNLSGVNQIDIKNSTHSLDISSLPPQIYIVSLYKSGILVYQEKIVKSN